MSLRSLEAERIDLGGICRDRTHRSTYCASFDGIHSSMERPPCVVEGLLVNLTQNINQQQSRLMQILDEQLNKPIRHIVCADTLGRVKLITALGLSAGVMNKLKVLLIDFRR